MPSPNEADAAIIPQSTDDAATTRTNEDVQLYPSAEELERYEKVLPGAGQRILVFMESQLSHRHTMELKQAAGEFMGQIFAFVIALTAIICGTITAIQGAELPGAIIGGSGVATLVSMFFYGQKHKKTNDR